MTRYQHTRELMKLLRTYKELEPYTKPLLANAIAADLNQMSSELESLAISYFRAFFKK